jgi:hypothetical protein
MTKETMTTNATLGFSEDPKNGAGIVRSRTTGQIRAWDIPKSLKAIQAFYEENFRAPMPGLYILLVPKTKVYVGEAKSLYDRLKQHAQSPEDKFKDWNKAILISDGRLASQSSFNDEAVRHEIETYLINLLKQNNYQVLSQGQAQTLNANQKAFVDYLLPELNYFLQRKTIITRLLDLKGQERIYSDAIAKALKSNGYKVGKVGASEAEVNGEKAFIRPGSRKPKGWQITIRGGKPGSFLDCFRKAEGYLIVPRGKVLVIPLAEVQKVVLEKAAYKRDTVDVWVNFEEDKVTLSYKSEVLDISQFRLT